MPQRHYQFWLVFLLKFLQFYLVDPILNLIFGWTSANGKKSDDDKSAQLVRVWMRGSFCSVMGPTLEDFLYCHISHVDPAFVLGKTNISLMSTSSKIVVFAVCPQHIDLANFYRYKSLSHAQFLEARHLIIMSLSTFMGTIKSHKFKEKKILILTSSGGNNSVQYLGQILAKIPRSKIMNEPSVLSQAHHLFQMKTFGRDQLINFIESILKYLIQEPGFDFLVVLLNMFSFPLIEFLKEVNPKPHLVFCTRPPLASIAALIEDLSGPHISYVIQPLAVHLGFTAYDYDMHSIVASAALMYAASCLVYIRNKEHFCTDPLFYDDILDNPLKAAFMATIKLEVVQQRWYKDLQNTLLPQFSEIPLKQLTNEEIELMKKVFVKLEIPFEVEWGQARLLSIFSRRKRKVGIIL